MWIHALTSFCQSRSCQSPLYHCVELVRHAVFGFEGWIDVWHVSFLVGFAFIGWRLAIKFMERKLIL